MPSLTNITPKRQQQQQQIHQEQKQQATLMCTGVHLIRINNLQIKDIQPSETRYPILRLVRTTNVITVPTPKPHRHPPQDPTEQAIVNSTDDMLGHARRLYQIMKHDEDASRAVDKWRRKAWEAARDLKSKGSSVIGGLRKDYDDF